jgi:large subunit ribosomal protein L23
MGIFGKKEDNKEVSTKKVGTKKTSKDDVISTVGAYNTIVTPIVTEKSHAMAANHKYTFRVAKDTTKIIVKKVIQDMYKVTVEDVNMIVVKPKRRTVKYDRGYQKLYKKAIVTVREGDHISVFEGV